MANKEHLRILMHGVEFWNKWRERNPDVKPRLRGVDLRGVNLSGADLIFADLSDAELSGVDLRGANLRLANLNVAYFSGAYLHGANLSGAKFSNANLSEADLGKAIVGDTIFGRVDLSEAKHLETINHVSPSTIGIDTIYRSKGNIPESFLKGCGFTELQIEQTKLAIPNLTPAEITDIGYKLIELRSDQKPLEFYSCFISYSHQDEAFTKRLHTRMQKEKLRTWYAPENIRGGRKLYEEIDRAISLQERFLIVLSENSMESEWVKTELYKARQREIKEKHRMLFPIGLVDFEVIRKWECFDADTGKDLAREVREYYVPDFSNWQNDDAFEEAFQKLLRDLTVEDNEKA